LLIELTSHTTGKRKIEKNLRSGTSLKIILSAVCLNIDLGKISPNINIKGARQTVVSHSYPTPILCTMRLAKRHDAIITDMFVPTKVVPKNLSGLLSNSCNCEATFILAYTKCLNFILLIEIRPVSEPEKNPSSKIENAIRDIVIKILTWFASL